MLSFGNIKENKCQSASSVRPIQSYADRSIFQLQDNRPGSFIGTDISQTYLADNRPQSIIQKKQTDALASHQPVYKSIQKKENKTGLPDNLKSGIENLSGISMDDVKVHYRSDKPAQLNAHAYAQGTDIHVAPGQEKHLPHEAWHVVQQKQGWVKPIMQMKSNVKINDDKGLEKEADVMGANAILLKPDNTNTPIKMTNTQAHIGPIQRVITINNAPQTVDEVYEKMLRVAPEFEEQRLALLYGILPAFDVHGETFGGIDELVANLSRILTTYEYLYNVGNYKDLGHFIHNQRIGQERIKANPAWYKNLVTTVGFEHEFADMQNSPLAGVSHMEIAETTEGLPFTGIKFLVETDASNALELVSPPFLFPTSKGSTVPMSTAVSTADELMKSALYRILTQKASRWLPDLYYNRSYITQTIRQLLLQLDAITGFTFRLKNNIEIKPGYLSHNTELNRLKDHVVAAPGHPNKMILNQHSLENINISKSEKGENESYSISSQVNFATDMGNALKLQQLGPAHGDAPIPRHGETVIYKRINEGLRNHIPAPAAGSPGLAAFYPLFIGKLAGLFSVYSQSQVRTAQAELHADLVAKATPLAADRNLGLPTQAARREFNLHAGMMSFVKDMTAAWIKDHVFSLAKGMLIPADYPLLLTSLEAANPAGFNLPGNIDLYLQAQGHTTTLAHWQHFIAEVNSAINLLKQRVEFIIIPGGSSVLMDHDPDVDLYEHNPGFIGARQDTYQDPTKIQMPQIHNKRLHVTEIRRGDPSSKLRDLEKDL